MFELLQRFFKFIQSSAHALLSRFENPISLAEQGIRDLKKDFDESMQGLAQIKATAIAKIGRFANLSNISVGVFSLEATASLTIGSSKLLNRDNISSLVFLLEAIAILRFK